MLIELAVPYADVRAGDLSLVLDAGPEPALEVLRRTLGGVEVELRLLGCSHQALVDGGATLSETVSCRPGTVGGLPARHEHGRYDFHARVEHLAPSEYAARARDLSAAAAADPDGLVGVFPGPGLAFTALRLRAAGGGDGAVWTTWHGYPQSGELVTTESAIGGAA